MDGRVIESTYSKPQGPNLTCSAIAVTLISSTYLALNCGASQNLLIWARTSDGVSELLEYSWFKSTGALNSTAWLGPVILNERISSEAKLNPEIASLMDPMRQLPSFVSEVNIVKTVFYPS